MTPAKKPETPVVGTAQIKLLQKLCAAVAVSGDESEVRSIVLEEVKGYAADVKVDALGSVLVTKPGRGANRLRVMLSAHMDEVGFMLVADEGEGIFRFDTVGGIDARQLPGKPVLVSREHIPGVIGARPIHLTTAEERKHAISLDNLRIDIGPAGGKVKLGDRAAFATPFIRSGPAIIAKALDNRFGVATLIELVKHAPANIDLLAVFSVQEEIGGRGAKVAAYAFDPQLAMAVDSTPAYDLPTHDEEENIAYNTKLGLGPAIYIADIATLSDPRLVRWLSGTGDELKIPYQFRQPGGGGTDAGAIHRSRAGIPSISVSVPHRYPHTAAQVARLDDWKNTLALLHAALSRLTPAILSGERG
jgi:tetrahedral aminopeptidase